MSYSEEEQVEKLKRFWQDHGTPILVGISLALAVFAGWRYWQQSHLETAAAAAAGYQAALEAAQKLTVNPDDKEANTELQRQSLKVIQDQAGTPYAGEAVFRTRAVARAELRGAGFAAIAR